MFYRQVVIYSVLWGVAMFVERYCAYSELPVFEFLFGWYTGSFAVMVIAFLWDRWHGGEKEAVPFYIKDYAMVFVYAIGIMTCLAIGYLGADSRPRNCGSANTLGGRGDCPRYRRLDHLQGGKVV